MLDMVQMCNVKKNEIKKSINNHQMYPDLCDLVNMLVNLDLYLDLYSLVVKEIAPFNRKPPRYKKNLSQSEQEQVLQST